MPIGNGLSSSPSSSRSLPLSCVSLFCGDLLIMQRHITTPSPTAVWISVHTLAQEHKRFTATRKRITWNSQTQTDFRFNSTPHIQKHCSVILGEQGLGQQSVWEFVGSCPQLCFYDDCPLGLCIRMLPRGKQSPSSANTLQTLILPASVTCHFQQVAAPSNNPLPKSVKLKTNNATMSSLRELLLNLTWTRRGAGRSTAITSGLLFSLASCQGVRPQFTGGESIGYRMRDLNVAAQAAVAPRLIRRQFPHKASIVYATFRPFWRPFPTSHGFG